MNFKAKGVKNGTLAAAAVMAIAAPFTAHHEGLRLKAYLDPVGIPTICYGETEGVELGMVMTRPDCDNMLAARLGYFAYQVDLIVQPPMTPETHAALASFAYNVGLSAFKSSTLVKKLNTGDLLGACNQLPRWIYAKGRKLPGLEKRRDQERALCLKGAK